MLKALTLLLLALTISTASASGRGGCRGEFGLESRVLCYAEQQAVVVGPVELWTGLEVRPLNLQITPYATLFCLGGSWWASLDIARPLEQGPAWRWGFAFGWRW